MPWLSGSTGDAVYSHRRAILAAWLAAAILLTAVSWLVRPADSPEPHLLPGSSPSRRAALALSQHFPTRSGLNEAALVFERAGRLTPADLDAIEQVASLIPTPSRSADARDLAGVTVRSPASLQPPRNPLTGASIWQNLLISHGERGSQAAMVLVDIPADYLSRRSDRVVRHIHAILAAQPLPEGLAAAVSGSAGFGHDYAAAALVSHRRAVKVTLVAVVLILLAVYRSPLAPLVPLGAISLAAVVAFACLGIADRLGLHTGTAEDIFVFVLIYGAGVDYTLLLISRYRELLTAGRQPAAAAKEALAMSLPTIVAAACTVTAGLAMMSFARYEVFRTAGPAVGIALVVALLASVTLAPAMVGMLAGRLFWPSRLPVSEYAGLVGGAGPRRRIWVALARAVTARPVPGLLVTLAALALPAWRGTKVTWVWPMTIPAVAVSVATTAVSPAMRVAKACPLRVYAVAGANEPAVTGTNANTTGVLSVMGLPRVSNTSAVTSAISAPSAMSVVGRVETRTRPTDAEVRTSVVSAKAEPEVNRIVAGPATIPEVKVLVAWPRLLVVPVSLANVPSMAPKFTVCPESTVLPNRSNTVPRTAL